MCGSVSKAFTTDLLTCHTQTEVMSMQDFENMAISWRVSMKTINLRSI